MKFGLFSLMPLGTQIASANQVVDDTRDMVVIAEQAGFETAWFAEHHFSNWSISPSPVMMAAHVAGYTKRIKLGTAVIVLPLYQPLRLAQEIAMLDIQSGGRAIIGIGSGYQRYEFDRFDVVLEDKTDIMLEYWTVLESILNDQHVRFKGKHIDLPETRFLLAPIQKPFPAFYVASGAPKVLRRAIDSGSTAFISGTWQGTAGLIASRERFFGALRSIGEPTNALPLVAQSYIHVTHDKRAAIEAAEATRYASRVLAELSKPDVTLANGYVEAQPFANEPPLETYRRNLIAGDPEYVAQRIAEEIELVAPAGYNCVFHWAGMDSGKAKKSLELFASEVMPLLKAEKRSRATAAAA